MISFVSNNYNNPCLLPPSPQRATRTQKSIFLNFTANITHQLQAAKDFPENLWQLYSFSLFDTETKNHMNIYEHLFRMLGMSSIIINYLFDE